ncbi:DUF6043 family protein [Alistipes sp. OttesenSCG-928-B03]|nr:DUF6043 family protein [Alistipes sp. OttesenSCG-928-B03]
MGSHPTEYAWLETEMNRKDDAGHQMVLAQAIALGPKYQEIISKPMNYAGIKKRERQKNLMFPLRHPESGAKY